MDKIRNIAIIAHVDHGKTTLVDCLLRQSGTFRANQKTDERMMDSMDLEREKGITIRAKNAAFQYNGYHVNIVDTPGHADFGGEVERIMGMIDGVLLVVDSHDGPQAQTKFVLKKAMEQGAKVIVVINKIDRENARPHKVLDMVFELFMELGASDEQLDFPVIYASAKAGYAVKEIDQERKDMTPLFDEIIKQIPPPTGQRRGLPANARVQPGLQRLPGPDRLRAHPRGPGERGRHGGRARTATAGASAATSRRFSAIRAWKRSNSSTPARATSSACAGLRTCSSARRSPTRKTARRCTSWTSTRRRSRWASSSTTARWPGARASSSRRATSASGWSARRARTFPSGFKETDTAGSFELSARGEMQIAVLVEQMRREGFEVLVSRPEVIYKRDDNGNLLEPYENLTVDVPNDNLGDILQSLASRKADITNMVHNPHSVLVEAIIPTRGLIGFETDLVNVTKGLGIASHLFKEYGPHKGEIPSRDNGVLVAMEGGVSTAYSLDTIQVRGRLFIGAQEEIYEGMIIGENARPDDLPVNPCKAKKLTNMRSQGDGKGISLAPPLVMTLERSLEYIAPDEYVEATPKSLRLRKKILDANLRKRAGNTVKV